MGKSNFISKADADFKTSDIINFSKIESSNLHEIVKNEFKTHNTEWCLKLFKKTLTAIKADDEDIDAISANEFATILGYRYSADKISTMNISDLNKRKETTSQYLNYIASKMSTMRKNSENGELYYDILMDSYIRNETLSLEAIAQKHNISRSYAYKLRGQAIDELSIYLWFAPNLLQEHIEEFILTINAISSESNLSKKYAKSRKRA